MLRVLDMQGSSEAMGDAHGRAYSDDIRAYANHRVSIVAGGLWSGGQPLSRGAVLEIAEACLPAHEQFSANLHAEMMAMAAAAGISPAEAVVVGGFTDFVDTVRAATGGVHPSSVIEDDCTAFIVPDERTDGTGFLGQTWDMHDTATDYVVLARLRPNNGPAAAVFTTVGCLGQIGMNETGVCVGVNNLTASDGRCGVTWPTVVRRMLAEQTAADALAVLLGAELAGAHNYLIFDSDGTGFSVEAMPSVRPVRTLNGEPLVHTNHTLNGAAKVAEAERDPDIMANSLRRLELATGMLAVGQVDAKRLMSLTREPSAICQTARAPYWVESSGAMIMRPATGDFWACWGPPAENEYEQWAMRDGITSRIIPKEAVEVHHAAGPAMTRRL